jgi:hypothetical protein
MERTLRVILVRGGKAKVDQESITKVLGNVALELLNDVATGGLVGAQDVAIILGVEPS